MTGIEVSLLIIGCIFMIGSFFVSEKLSGTEINRIAELSDNELKIIISKGMEHAGSRIDDLVDEKVEEAAEKVEIALERESNMKIMAIGEYSDTIFESMKHTHDEIMFLYSMLNDKHVELTSLTGDLQRLAANIRNIQETVEKQKEAVERAVMSPSNVNDAVAEKEMTEPAEREADEIQAVPEEMENIWETALLENHNDKILALHREGLSKVDIARKLKLGVGEVSLVIGLYKGDKE